MPKAGWQERQIRFTCEFCTRPFGVRPSRVRLQRSPVRFCSKWCHDESLVKVQHAFICSKCGEQKGPGDFFKDNMNRRGHVARCKACYKEARRAKIEAGADRTPPQHCDICSDHVARPVFDHCHATGRFRGWLCDRCNLTLGKVKDSAELLRKMIAYLDANSAITHLGRY